MGELEKNLFIISNAFVLLFHMALSSFQSLFLKFSWNHKVVTLSTFLYFLFINLLVLRVQGCSLLLHLFFLFFDVVVLAGGSLFFSFCFIGCYTCLLPCRYTFLMVVPDSSFLFLSLL